MVFNEQADYYSKLQALKELKKRAAAMEINIDLEAKNNT